MVGRYVSALPASSPIALTMPSVEQGREYVEAYVQFTHFAEQADHLADAGASHQHQETLAGH